MLELIQMPFVQRALISGILLALLTSVLGVITLIRRASFYGDTIAHASLAGVAIGLWLGWYPLYAALLYAIAIAFMLPWFQAKFRLPLDNILGIILPSSMGLGVVLFSLLPGFQPTMMSFLFGNILTIQTQDIIALCVLAIIAFVIFIYYLPKLLFISIDPQYAKLLKINTVFLQRIYEVLLAAVIIAGVKLIGVVLINALLIIPASAAKLHAKSLSTWIIYTIITSIGTVVGGMIVSILLDIPPGATIAVFAAFIFFVSGLVKITRY